jgi:hypothetical protein
LKRNSKFFVQLAAGKIWEKVPVALSIVEKKVLSPRPPYYHSGDTAKNPLFKGFFAFLGQKRYKANW